jgi:uncharacterized protein
MKEQNIVSPCISICKNDPVSGCCYGCGRTNEEKKIWKDEKTSDEWKNKNLLNLKKKMSTLQLETFEESYSQKKKDISLVKKNNF